MESPGDAAGVADTLAGWISQEVGQPATVGGLRRTSYGYSRENWVFTGTWDGVSHELILRRDPPGSVLVTDRKVEAGVLGALAGLEVPVPQVRWIDLAGGRLGRPSLVLDLCPGACEPFVLNGPQPLEQRVALAHEIYDRLAAIHRVDWRAAGLDRWLQDPGPEAPITVLDDWAGQLADVRLDPEPELAYVVAWLRARAPRAATTVLVHGDFKPGNVLLEGGRVSAVLDWESAHLGDPHEDLGWVTNPLRAGEHRIAGAWEPADLLDRWSAATGHAVDHDALAWWQVLANLKLAVILLRGTKEFLDGRLDRLLPPPSFVLPLLLDQIEGVEGGA